MDHNKINRKLFVGGNWKCNGTPKSVDTILTNLNRVNNFEINVVIAVPNIYLLKAKEIIGKGYSISAQDVSHLDYGAYTGENSAQMLKDAEIDWTIVGHSERRKGFDKMLGESIELIGEKAKKAIKYNMNVIFCIGESLDERLSNKTLEVCISQLKPLCKMLTLEEWKNIVLAYEPVWAIGTGKVATPIQAENTHFEIRQWIKNNVSLHIGNNIQIIYGGSVNAGNCENLLKENNIDGFLVGGASLKPEFNTIVKRVSNFV